MICLTENTRLSIEMKNKKKIKYTKKYPVESLFYFIFLLNWIYTISSMHTTLFYIFFLFNHWMYLLYHMQLREISLIHFTRVGYLIFFRSRLFKIIEMVGHRILDRIELKVKICPTLNYWPHFFYMKLNRSQWIKLRWNIYQRPLGERSIKWIKLAARCLWLFCFYGDYWPIQFQLRD